MPLYEYKCEQGHVSEVVMSSKTRVPSLPCRWCGADAVRVISAPNVLTVPVRASKESAVSRAIGRVRQGE